MSEKQIKTFKHCPAHGPISVEFFNLDLYDAVCPHCQLPLDEAVEMVPVSKEESG